jgi:minor curlin subunit
MKTLNFKLLAASLLFAGAAYAQAPNARPALQPGSYTALALPSNLQIGETLRSAAIDNESFVLQVGTGNYGNVDQVGVAHVADLIQVGNGNDAFQKQRGGAAGGAGGQNKAWAEQYGNDNYSDQDQNGNFNEAIASQGEVTGARDRNYNVQEQDGTLNYGLVDQDSNRNFAHQKQIGLFNFADTRQGNGAPSGSFGLDGQWSQVTQLGVGNAAVVRQDHD